jgi:transposase
MYEEDYQDDEDLATSPTASLSFSMTSLEHSPQSPSYRYQPRRSLRKSITAVLVSPVRVAKDCIHLSNPIVSPRRMSRSLKHSLAKTGSNARNILSPRKDEHKSWREELDVPQKTRPEEAMAILLCRELECMDL